MARAGRKKNHGTQDEKMDYLGVHGASLDLWEMIFVHEDHAWKGITGLWWVLMRNG